jgi:hypothetical protein
MNLGNVHLDTNTSEGYGFVVASYKDRRYQSMIKKNRKSI